MRREPADTRISPWSTFFVWKQCCRCRQEFRRERGWVFMIVPDHGGHAGRLYICSVCASTHEEALKQREQEIKDREPKFPPPNE